MTDRQLRDASARMNAALRRIPAPEPPSRQRRPAVLAAATAAAVIVLLGGWALFVRDGQERLDAAGPGSSPAAASCPVTVPTTGFVPPERWPAEAPNGVWFGTGALWTEVPAAGHRWDDLPVAPSGALTQKLFFWSEHYTDPGLEPEPALTITARLLDATSPPVVETHATNGSRFDTGVFMLSGVELPAPGCWEITGEYRGATLTYVAEVGGGSTG